MINLAVCETTEENGLALIMSLTEEEKRELLKAWKARKEAG